MSGYMRISQYTTVSDGCMLVTDCKDETVTLNPEKLDSKSRVISFLCAFAPNETEFGVNLFSQQRLICRE